MIPSLICRLDRDIFVPIRAAGDQFIDGEKKVRF